MHMEVARVDPSVDQPIESLKRPVGPDTNNEVVQLCWVCTKGPSDSLDALDRHETRNQGSGRAAVKAISQERCDLLLRLIE